MPGTLQLVKVSKTPVRVQTLLVQNDSVMLVNPDITNNIFIGNDPGSQIIPVPALGSVTLDTKKHDLWISTNGGNFTVDAILMPNGSNWVPSPAQVAAQINALGLAKDTTVTSVVNNTTGVAKDTSVNAVNTTLGTPAQDGTVTGVNNSLVFGTTPAIQNLTTGGNPGGIPVLRGTDNLGIATNQSMPANSSTNIIAGVNITKPSFEAVFKVNAPAGVGAIPFGVLHLFWQDSNTGLQVGYKAYVLTAGNGSANALTFYISGPCRGNQLVAQFANRDPAQAFTVTWAINQTSHVYTIDRLLQTAYAATAPNGFVNPSGNPVKGLLYSSQPSIGPSGTVTRLCAASNAKCKLGIDNGAQANGCAVIIETPSSTTLYDEAQANFSIMGLVAAAGLRANQEFQMPNGPVQVRMVNQAGTNTITPAVSIVAMEY